MYFLYASYFDYSGKGLLQPVKSYYDFGHVSVQSNIISTDIDLLNIGEGDLTIEGLDTSCGCTSAMIINGDKEGPVYGMKGSLMNPNDWSMVIQSGEKVTLRIFYDPKAHPNLRGAVTRVVNIYTDDPSNNIHEIRIGVTQID